MDESFASFSDLFVFVAWSVLFIILMFGEVIPKVYATKNGRSMVLLMGIPLYKIGKSFPFYVSIAVLVYYVCITPLILLNDLYRTEELVFRIYFDKLISVGNYFLHLPLE